MSAKQQKMYEPANSDTGKTENCFPVQQADNLIKTHKEENIMIRPLQDRVVIKKLEAEEKTQGGLILTSSAKEAPQMAEVIAVGPGTKDEPMEIKVGDKVIFAKYGGTDVKYQGTEYTIMRQADILAVVE